MDKDTSREVDPVLVALGLDPTKSSDPARAAEMQRVLRRDVQELWDSNFAWPSLEVASVQTAYELIALCQGTPIPDRTIVRLTLDGFLTEGDGTMERFTINRELPAGALTIYRSASRADPSWTRTHRVSNPAIRAGVEQHAQAILALLLDADAGWATDPED